MAVIGGLHVSTFEAIVAEAHDLIQQGGAVYADVWWWDGTTAGGEQVHIIQNGPLHAVRGQIGVEGHLTFPPYPANGDYPIDITMVVDGDVTLADLASPTWDGRSLSFRVDPDGVGWKNTPARIDTSGLPGVYSWIAVVWPATAAGYGPQIVINLSYLSPALVSLIKKGQTHAKPPF